MNIGVSFQPGQNRDSNLEAERRATGQYQGVQEAIKILSLKLPRVVGANAVAPSALLTAQGSGGHPSVDSMVEKVLQKYFPQASQMPNPQASMAPSFQQMQPPVNISGVGQSGFSPRRAATVDSQSFAPPLPRIITDVPPLPPLSDWFGPGGHYRPGSPTPEPSLGSPSGFPGMISPLPSPLPDLRKQLDWVPDYSVPNNDVPLI